MSIERELQGYVPNWRGKPREQTVAEVASYIEETKRVPDYYEFILTPQGELYSKSHKCIVKNIVERGSYIAEAEYEALLHTERIACEKDSGLIVWIAPRYSGVYVPTKIIYSEIIKRGRIAILWNRAVIYDDLTDCEVLQLACDLAQKDCSNPIPESLEDVRKRPIYVPVKGIHWTFLVGEHLVADTDWRMIRRNEDVKLKEQALLQAEIFYDTVIDQPYNTYELLHSQQQIFGPFGGSCPPFRVTTAFNMLFRTSKECWTGNCPLCGAYNKGLKPGDRCQGCKEVYQGCG